MDGLTGVSKMHDYGSRNKLQSLFGMLVPINEQPTHKKPKQASRHNDLASSISYTGTCTLGFEQIRRDDKDPM